MREYESQTRALFDSAKKARTKFNRMKRRRNNASGSRRKLASTTDTMERCLETIRRAEDVLYGDVGTRLAEEKGRMYAEIIRLKYIEGKTWDEVAMSVGYCPKHCQDLSVVAFAFMDEHVGVGAEPMP